MTKEELTHNTHLTVMYDGTNYSGWQMQHHSLSIQQIIQDTIGVVLQEEVKLIGAGRTDAGVHALAQVAHFKSKKEVKLPSFFRSINGLLPKDIRIREVIAVPLDFHALRSAKGKVYHYNIALGPIISPFDRLYAFHVPQKIDLDVLQKAAHLFVGKHDFTAFANSASEGSASKNPIRTIYRIDIVMTENGLRLEFEGNGFLYKMVRNIVGMLLEIATGKRPISDIKKVFEAKDRRLASKAAPAHGLFLVKVLY